MPIENVSDEEIELHLSKLFDKRGHGVVWLQHEIADGPGPFIQFQGVDRRRGRFFYTEAGSNETLDPRFKLTDEQVSRFASLGWELPKKRSPNFSREFEPTSPADVKEIVALVRQTFRDGYGVPEDAQITLKSDADAPEERRKAKLARKEEKLAERERAGRRATVMGSAVVVFNGENLITVRRGFRGKKEYEVDGRVSAIVESGGNLRTHPTLTRTVAGFAVTGLPVGAAWWKKTGDLFLLIEGPDWAEFVVLDPKRAAEAQKFAQQVNLAARVASGSHVAEAVAERESPVSTTSDPSTVIDQLERLTNLREQGALTDEEFETQKRRILEA